MSGFVNPLARKRAPGYPEAIDRLKAATREQLHLSDDVVVCVTELACREPGCPDVETIIAVLTAGKKPRTVRFHKRIIEIDGPELAAALHEVES
ncbi:MAG TPA: nitrate reductase [Xanthobacteraceae bacterium]|nr:nitrate reductase [Xanthobacteraceae bacterium]